jgi:hypothetical protein
MTNGVTTISLKRWRIMQEQETTLHQLSLLDICKPAAVLNNPVSHHRTIEENARAFPPLEQHPKKTM